MDEDQLEGGGFHLTHLHEKQLEAYVLDHASEREQELIEHHLFNCDDCMEKYMKAIESWETEVEMSEDFTDATLQQINKQTAFWSASEKKQLSNKKRTLIHYVIAAGLTLVLMTTGLFQELLEVLDDSNINKGPSITENMMNRTGGWLDKMNEWNEGERTE